MIVRSVVLAACVACVQTACALVPYRVEGFDPNGVRFDVTNLVARARSSDGEAYYRLGVMFLCGHQVPQNHYVAYEYFLKAEDLGYGPASLLLGFAADYGGSYKGKGVALCQTLPFRELIVERGYHVLHGLEAEGRDARVHYSRALSNGIDCAVTFMERRDSRRRAEERRLREREEARRRILSGDCRTGSERETYRRHVESETRWKAEQDARRAQAERDAETQRTNRVAAVVRQAEERQAAQVARLKQAEGGAVGSELYWAACFLRAWAATAADAERRVGLARRSLECLRRAAELGHAESAYRLGLMLWCGDVGVLGPDPVNRGGFLGESAPSPLAGEWIPEKLEVVKETDVRGPSFAPLVRIRQIDGGVTNVGYVLLYRQDVKRGLSLIRRAAEKGLGEAIAWSDERKREGWGDDFMPWMLDGKSFDASAGRDCLTVTVCVRSNAFLGHVFRHLKYDRKTGELVARSAEDPQCRAASPWAVSTGNPSRIDSGGPSSRLIPVF